MEEWKEYKLGEIANFTTGKLNSNAAVENGKYPFFTCSPQTFRINDYAFDQDAILLAGNNAEGKFNIKRFSGKFNAYQRTYVISEKDKNEIDLDYLFYALKLYLNEFKHISQGTATKFLTAQILNAFPIQLPTLETQQKIAAILSSLDEKIELNNKINENLEQQAQALFKSWFIDLEPFGGKMPEEWKVGKLSDIADYLNGYAFSSKELLNEPGENCLDVFKQGHIKKGGGFIPDGTKSWYPLSKCQKLKNYILKKGDILMAMTDMKGNVAILGNTAIMPVDDKYIVNQRVGLLRAKKELNIDYPYLYLLTNDQDFLMDLRSRANSGVQVNLSSTAIKESEVNIAPKEVYKQFNDIILPLFEKILANQQENQKLANVRDSVLPKLMNGEIEV